MKRNKSPRQIGEEKSRTWNERITTELNEIKINLQKLDIQIKELSDKRDSLRYRRDRLSANLIEGRTFEFRNGSDTAYVLAKDLSVYINRYREENGPTAMRILAARSGVSQRTIRSIKTCTGRNTVTLFTADRILTAMGIPKVLDTLEIVPFRNVPEPPHSQYYEE